MDKINNTGRLNRIKKDLTQIRGITALSRRTGVTRWWIYCVLNGEGKSERILCEAEELIIEHKKQEQQKPIH